METRLDLHSWKRRPHFEFFKDFELPFFNLCAPVDVTGLAHLCRERQISFFLATVFLSTKTANAIEEFRHRIRDGGVAVHDVIHPGSTILNEDQTFGFCHFTHHASFRQFHPAAEAALAAFHGAGRGLDDQPDRDDRIYYSVLPWVSFTSFAHARTFRRHESIPRIVFGRHFEEHGLLKMPVSVEVHHALVDGWHVGRYFEEFQALLSNAEQALELNG
jgi:chloramphenicol O-acetyltransferase type A